MSNPCRLLLWAPALALGVSCAERPDPVRVAASLPVERQPFVFDVAALKAAQAPNPYAPIRSPKGRHFSWQSPTRSDCEHDPRALNAPSPAFRGSAVAFPLLAGVQSSAERLQAQNTWGGDEPAPSDRTGPSPDLVVAALRPRFHQCFSRWLDQRADAEGSVRFALEVGCAGAVQAISAEVQGVDDSTVGCLFGVVGPARFGAPVNGHATIQVPVVLKNTSR